AQLVRKRHQEIVFGAICFLRYAIRVRGAASFLLGLQPRLALLDQGAPRLLRLFPVADVARNFREAAQFAAAVENGRDDDVRPEARSVLTHAPPFVFDTSLRARDLQFMLRFVIRLVFLGIETREVASDDLARLVALDPLCALVPWD